MNPLPVTSYRAAGFMIGRPVFISMPLDQLSGTIGFAIALGLCALVNMAPMPMRFQGMILTWQAGGGAIATLILIGVITSTYPARRAAQLPPVEALRSEA